MSDAVAEGSGAATRSQRSSGPGSAWARYRSRGRTIPVLTVLLVLIVIWYLAALGVNADRAERLLGQTGEEGIVAYATAVWSMERPALPAPHQLAIAMWDQAVGQPVTSARSVVHHMGVTISSTLVGFVAGTVLGIVLAIGIVHARTLERSLMPWVIASQTIPILALAPIFVVVLGQLGVTGVWPKALIATYLSFFPVTIAMVKGLRSPDVLQRDLMHTYSASGSQTFRMLRWPSAVPFLFPALKIGIALSIVGAIVAEVTTSAQAGLGAWLLQGSYHGLVFRMWGALFFASALAIVAIAVVGLLERVVAHSRGGRA